MKDNRIKNTKEALLKPENTVKEESPYLLSVFSPFRKYKRGDLIADDKEVTEVLGCHEQHMVNKIKKTIDKE